MLDCIFTPKELNNLTHVLPIIRANIQSSNSLNLSSQYFSSVSRYVDEADWRDFSNVKNKELNSYR